MVNIEKNEQEVHKNDKTFLQKILSSGMKSCINSYIENKHERDRARRVLEKGADINAIAYISRNSKVDLLNINRWFVFVAVITLIVEIFLLPNLNELNIIIDSKISHIIIALVVLFLPIIVALKFKKLQCDYLLNEFRKIDEITANEDLIEHERNSKILQEAERLKKDKAACNLFLK